MGIGELASLKRGGGVQTVGGQVVEQKRGESTGNEVEARSRKANGPPT